MGDKAKQSAGEIVETHFSSQKEKASGGMVDVAEALRKSGEHLRGQQQDQIAGLAEKAADHVERISSYMKPSNLRQLVDEVEGLARREPALFLGGAFVLGVGSSTIDSSESFSASRPADGPRGALTMVKRTPRVERSLGELFCVTTITRSARTDENLREHVARGAQSLLNGTAVRSGFPASSGPTAAPSLC